MTQRLLSIILIAFSLYSCSEKATNLTVTGDVENLTNGTVYLQHVGYGAIDIIDSAKIENGHFDLKTWIDDTAFYRLKLSNGLYGSLILRPNENLVVSGDASRFEPTMKVTGSVSSERLRELVQIQIDYYNKKESLTQSLQRIRDKSKEKQYIQLLGELQKEMANYPISLIQFNEKYPGDLATLTSIEELDPQQYEDAHVATYEALLQTMPNSEYVVEFGKRVAPLLRFKTGSVAPDFTLNDPSGQPLSLSQLKGQYVLLDFWASWCRPCRAENPNIVKAYNQYKDYGFTVLSVSLDGVNRQGQDPRVAWTQAITQDGLIWPYHVSDLQGWQSSVVALYNVTSIPKSFLIDKDGKIIAKNLRGPQLDQKLKTLFN